MNRLSFAIAVACIAWPLSAQKVKIQWIKADSPAIEFVGRTLAEGDGSVRFD